MSTDYATLVLGAQTDGLKTAEGAYDSLGDAAEKAEKRSVASSNKMAGAIGKLAGQLVAAATIAGTVRGYARLADSWSDMQSKIGAATKDVDGAAKSMRRMVDIANASYAPLNQTVDIYTRNVGVLRDLGKNAEQAADFTEALNHMMVITATKGENAVVVQNALSRAIAIGGLRAMEYETIMSRSPRVLEAIARELGVTVIQLRALATEGKVTGQVIADSLINDLQRARDEADKMPPTIADGFQRITTGITALVGTFDKLKDASGAVASALVLIGDGLKGAADFMSDHAKTIGEAFDVIRNVVIALAVVNLPAMVSALAATSLGIWAATAAGAALGFVLNALPLVALVTGLTLLWKAVKNQETSTSLLDKAQAELNKSLDLYANTHSPAAKQAAMDATEALIKQAEANLAIVDSNLLVFKSFEGLNLDKFNQGILNDLVPKFIAEGEELRAQIAGLKVDAEELAKGTVSLNDGMGSVVASLEKVTAATYTTIPGFAALRAEYGSAAGAIERLLEVQNQLAVGEFQARLPQMTADLANLAGHFDITTEAAWKYALALSDAMLSGDLSTQATVMAQIAVEMANAAGGAEKLQGEARLIYDALVAAAPEAARLAVNIDTANAAGGNLRDSIARVAAAFDGPIAKARELAGILSSAMGTLGAIGSQIASLIPGARQLAGFMAAARGGISAMGTEVASVGKGWMNSLVGGATGTGGLIGIWTNMQKIAAEGPKAEKALKKVGGGAGGAGKAAGGAAKDLKKLNDEIEKLEFDADPLKKYNAELKNLQDLKKQGLSDKAFDKAVEKLNEDLAAQLPLVNDLAQAWTDWVMRGFKDFKGFVKQVIGSFKKMIADMIMTAARNKIMIALGFTGGGLGGAAGAAAGVLGGGGGAAGGLGALGGLGGIGGAFMAGMGDVAFGLMNGGLMGGISTIGTALGGATSGLAGLATAAGAIALPLLAVAGIFSFFKKKTKELDSGMKVTVKGLDALGQTFKTIETKRFWGLSKKVRTSWSNMSEEAIAPIDKIIKDLGRGVLDMASILGKGPNALDAFSASFQLSLKGMSDADAQKAIAEEIQKFGDKMVETIFGETVTQTIIKTGSNWLNGAFGNIFQNSTQTVTTTTTQLSQAFKNVQREGEGALETLTRLVSALVPMNDYLDILGKGLQEATLQGAHLSSVMVDAFGGVQAMAQAVESYWEAFYTEEERIATITRRLSESMIALGAAMPSDREGFRALIDGINISTEAGAKLYAELIKLAGGFDTIFSAADRAAEELLAKEQAAEDALRALQKSISDFVESILADQKLMPTSQSQFAKRTSLQVNETKAIEAAQAGDMEKVRNYLNAVREAAASDLAYREVAARVMSQLQGTANSPGSGGAAGDGTATDGLLPPTGNTAPADPTATLYGQTLEAILKQIVEMRDEDRQLNLRADSHRKTTADTLEKWDIIGAPVRPTSGGGAW